MAFRTQEFPRKTQKTLENPFRASLSPGGPGLWTKSQAHLSSRVGLTIEVTEGSSHGWAFASKDIFDLFSLAAARVTVSSRSHTRGEVGLV